MLTRYTDARSFSNALADVVNRNITTLIWVGDAGKTLLLFFRFDYLTSGSRLVLQPARRS